MKLDEILINPNSHDENIGNYINFFTNAKVVWNEHLLSLKYLTHDDLTLLGMFDGNELISMLSLNQGDPYPTVDFAATSIAYRNQGYLRFLFKWHVENIGPFLSSNIQTTEAQWTWKSFINHNGNLHFYLYDLNSGTKSKIDSSNSPWDNDDNTCILVENRILRESHGLRKKIRWWGFTDQNFDNP